MKIKKYILILLLSSFFIGCIGKPYNRNSVSKNSKRNESFRFGRAYKKATLGVYHLVRPCQILSEIASGYRVSQDKIRKYNSEINFNKLIAGTRVFVPNVRNEKWLAAYHCDRYRRSKGYKTTAEAKKSAEKKQYSYKKTPGKKMISTGFIWPVKGRITKKFGLSGGKMSNGIDIAANAGISIKAISSGMVIHSGEFREYGNLIIMQHDNGYYSLYAHNQKNLVKEGTWIKQGTAVGIVGSTGIAKSAKLHFELRNANKKAVNPVPLLDG